MFLAALLADGIGMPSLQPVRKLCIVHCSCQLSVISYQLWQKTENRKPKTIVHWLMLAQHHVDDGVDIGNVDLAVASDIGYVH